MNVHPALHRQCTGDILAMHWRSTVDTHRMDTTQVCVYVERRWAAIALLNTYVCQAPWQAASNHNGHPQQQPTTHAKPQSGRNHPITVVSILYRSGIKIKSSLVQS